MLWCIVPLILSTAETGPPAGRVPPLDSLAADIIALGAIPESGRLILLAAFNGWPGPIGSITLIEGPPDENLDLFTPGDALWGYAGEGDGGVLVTAAAPPCIPEGLPLGTSPGDTVRFRLLVSGAPVDSVLLSAPDSRTTGSISDAEGWYTFRTASPGIYWVEAMADGGFGPEVLLLLPVLCGMRPEDALADGSGIPSSHASSLEQVFAEMNELRGMLGGLALARDSALDLVAGQRADSIALSGQVRHSPGLAAEMGEGGNLFAENIGRGSGLDEAWSMILTSPAHLSACLCERYDRVGMAAAVDVGREGWQLVLVQVFSGRADGVAP
jgi:uncharacterized protein YkwD